MYLSSFNKSSCSYTGESVINENSLAMKSWKLSERRWVSHINMLILKLDICEICLQHLYCFFAVSFWIWVAHLSNFILKTIMMIRDVAPLRCVQVECTVSVTERDFTNDSGLNEATTLGKWENYARSGKQEMEVILFDLATTGASWVYCYRREEVGAVVCCI